MINVAEVAKTLTSPVCAALPAFHAFTGSDYTASFLRKAKARPYDLMTKNPKYLSAFADLGSNRSVKPEVIDTIEDLSAACVGSVVQQM